MNDIEITKREVIASISILAIMMIIGIVISGKLNEYNQDQNAKYNKAFKISKDKDLFAYAMKTNVGNVFAEGEIKAVDTVSNEDIEGKYLIIEKIKEKYTKHTRTVTTTVNGKTKTRTETYWTWDRVGSETFKSKELTFLGSTFKTSKFNLPTPDYITTISGGYHIRYRYYGLEPKFKATIFATLKENTIINDDVRVYKDKNISEALSEATSDISIYVFWVLWIIISGIVIFTFMYFDNDWLNR